MRVYGTVFTCSAYTISTIAYSTFFAFNTIWTTTQILSIIEGCQPPISLFHSYCASGWHTEQFLCDLPTWTRDFCTVKHLSRIWSPPCPVSDRHCEVLPQELSSRGVNLIASEIKNEWSCTSTPQVPSWRGSWLSTFKAVPWLRRLVAGLSARRPGFNLGSVHLGFVVDKVALGQVFSKYFGFSLPISFRRCSSTRKGLIIFITGLHNKR
jgi:hypothetical protein